MVDEQVGERLRLGPIIGEVGIRGVDEFARRRARFEGDDARHVGDAGALARPRRESLKSESMENRFGFRRGFGGNAEIELRLFEFFQRIAGRRKFRIDLQSGLIS